MMHLSRKRYIAMAEQGLYRMPTTLHVTYCGRSGVTSHEVDTLEKHITCQDCITAMCYEEMDLHNCESHPGGG